MVASVFCTFLKAMSRSTDRSLFPKRLYPRTALFVSIYDVAVMLDRFPLSNRCCTGLLVCFYKRCAVDLDTSFFKLGCAATTI